MVVGKPSGEEMEEEIWADSHETTLSESSPPGSHSVRPVVGLLLRRRNIAQHRQLLAERLEGKSYWQSTRKRLERVDMFRKGSPAEGREGEAAVYL